MKYKILFSILLASFLIGCWTHSHEKRANVKSSLFQKSEDEIDSYVEWEAKHTAESPKHLIDQIRKHLQTVTVAETNKPISFAGHYTSGVGLSGEELYLFPDKTYMYTQWSDITPEILHDQGAWSLSHGFLQLISDKTITKEGPEDTLYVGLYYDGKTPLKRYINDETRSGLVLMGANWDYSWYLRFIQSDIDEGLEDQEIFNGSFLICTLKKIEDIKIKDIDKIKKSFSEEDWDY